MTIIIDFNPNPNRSGVVSEKLEEVSETSIVLWEIYLNVTNPTGRLASYLFLKDKMFDFLKLLGIVDLIGDEVSVCLQTTKLQ